MTIAPDLSENIKKVEIIQRLISLILRASVLLRKPISLAGDDLDVSEYLPKNEITPRPSSMSHVLTGNRTVDIVALSKCLVSSLVNFLAHPDPTVSSYKLAVAIVNFCRFLREERCGAPILLRTLIDNEAANLLMFAVHHSLNALVRQSPHDAIAFAQQAEATSVHRNLVSFSMVSIARDNIRTSLDSIELVLTTKDRNDPVSVSPVLPWGSPLKPLVEMVIQIITYAHRFALQVNDHDVNDRLWANLCLLCNDVVGHMWRLMGILTRAEGRLELSRLWVSSKALIDILANEEEFTDELLDGPATGRKVLFVLLRQIHTSRNNLRMMLK